MKKHRHDQAGFHHIVILLMVLVIESIGFVGYRVVKTNKKSAYSQAGSASVPSQTAEEAGKSLSNNYCKGSGATTFTHLPMYASDFSILIAYGVTVGGHVTPVDHQYFSPTVFNSPKDKYPVYAMADSQITNIEVHPTRIRLVFTVSCTFIYYYDLL